MDWLFKMFLFIYIFKLNYIFKIHLHVQILNKVFENVLQNVMHS